MIKGGDDPAPSSCHLTDSGTHYSSAPAFSAHTKPRPSPISVPRPEAFTLPEAMPTPTLRHRCSTLPMSASPAASVRTAGSRYSLPPRLLEDVSGEAWFWSHMSREQCKERLLRDGSRGEYVVRINDRGECVMSVW